MVTFVGLADAELALGRDEAAAAAFARALRQGADLAHVEIVVRCLRGCSVVAARRRDAVRAVRLDAAADKFEETLGTAISMRAEDRADVELAMVVTPQEGFLSLGGFFLSRTQGKLRELAPLTPVRLRFLSRRAAVVDEPKGDAGP